MKNLCVKFEETALAFNISKTNWRTKLKIQLKASYLHCIACIAKLSNSYIEVVTHAHAHKHTILYTDTHALRPNQPTKVTCMYGTLPKLHPPLICLVNTPTRK